jgi:hypothetical protein
MRPGQDVLDAAAAGAAREWLLADGTGSSTLGNVAFVPSARGHALLHASDERGRVTTLLLGLEERLQIEGALFDLAPAPGLAAAALEDFRLDPWPVWRLRCGELALEREILLIHGHRAVAALYRHVSGPAARLRLSPLVVARPPHGQQRETPALRGVAHGIPGRVRIETLDQGPTLTIWHNGSFFPARLWRRGIERAPDARAGGQEDALVPGYVDATLGPGDTVHLVASTEEALFRSLAAEGRLGTPPPGTLAGCVTELALAERARVRRFMSAALEGSDFTARQAAAAHGDDRVAPLLDAGDPWAARLVAALEQGLVRRGGRLTVLARYPEGDERGVEALRSLPGLVAVRAFAEARAVLSGYLGQLDDGLVPEAFDLEDGSPRYGDPAPALWAVHAAELLARRSEALDWLREGAFAQLESIMQFFRSGTRHGVRVGADGLLEQGEGSGARRPSGLNALWYHALVAMAQLARLTGSKESAAFYLAWARQHGEIFNAAFWSEADGRLHETLAPERPLPGLSPGQLLAVSLAPPLLAPERSRRLVETVERELFTPLGLRDAPGSARLDPTWLGPFFTATLRVHGRSPESQARVLHWLEALRQRVAPTSLAHLPALYEPPARRPGRRARKEGLDSLQPRGASPLAAAELLRVWVEDVTHAAEPATVHAS